MNFEAYFGSKYANGALCNEPYSVNEETKQMLKEAYEAGMMDAAKFADSIYKPT